MSRYWLLEPCTYLHDGKVVQHIRVPEVPIELDDETATELGDKVRAVDENPEESVDESDAPKRGRQKAIESPAETLAPADPPVDPPVDPAGDGGS